MIKYTSGNIFDSGATVLVNTTNTRGVMGAGLAKQFKSRYPKMFKSYKKACNNKTHTTKKAHLFRENGQMILNVATKDDWRDNSKIEYIKSACDEIVRLCETYKVESIAMVRLGCGLGGLDFETQVKPIMESKLGKLKRTEILIYV